jgi:hypothetical protein
MNNRAGGFAAAGLLLAVAVGCGSGEYEQRLEARVEQLEKGSSFRGLQNPVPVPETPLSVRLPAGFSTSPLVEGDMVEGQPVDSRRMQPGSLNTGYPLTPFEAFVTDDTGGKLAYYCYFGVADLTVRGADKMEFRILNRFADVFPDTKVAWEDVAAPMPSGASIDWQRAEAASRQKFLYVTKEGGHEYRDLDAKLEIWVRRVEDKHLPIMIWRVPDWTRNQAKPDYWAPRVAGTMEVAE